MKKMFENRNYDPKSTIRVQPEWLSTEEAADYLSISPNALRIHVCRGKIRSYKFGSRLRFRISDLREHMILGKT
jgi:excisionase family DNA binding protein